jgi:hypothetical protein
VPGSAPGANLPGRATTDHVSPPPPAAEVGFGRALLLLTIKPWSSSARRLGSPQLAAAAAFRTPVAAASSALEPGEAGPVLAAALERVARLGRARAGVLARVGEYERALADAERALAAEFDRA